MVITNAADRRVPSLDRFRKILRHDSTSLRAGIPARLVGGINSEGSRISCTYRALEQRDLTIGEVTARLHTPPLSPTPGDRLLFETTGSSNLPRMGWSRPRRSNVTSRPGPSWRV